MGLRVFIIFMSLLFSISVDAAEFQNIEYKNIKDGAKILFDGTNWVEKFDKKSTNYFIKKDSVGISNYSEFYSIDDRLLFSTGTQYEFLNNGSLIGYSNYDLKFYEFFFENDLLLQRELTIDEVQSLFPKYKIIKISDFSKTTNCLKIKKQRKPIKLILLNDTDGYFYNYGFTTNNAKIEKYRLSGILKVKSKGMVQFSAFEESSKKQPWYVLLIR